MKIILIYFKKLKFAKQLEKEVASFFSDFFPIKIESREEKENIKERREFLNKKQYSALDFIHKASREVKEADYCLGITNKDIFVEETNFIFGLAWLPEKTAIISLTRLRCKDKKLFFSRVKKESLHELLHLLGFSHCPDAKCIMHFSNCIEDTDYKEKLCNKCKNLLRKKFQ